MSDPNEKQYSVAAVELTPAAVEEERVILGEPPKETTWRRHLWSTIDSSKEERWFITKLDFTLISCSALGVMIRYLDQTNITNAFNSGMKEDLGLFGNQLNYANAFWSAGYAVGQVPSNLILTRVRAPYYICTIELLWTAFTFGTSGVKNASQLYALRFFVGLFEAGHFPAVMYVTSSYFRPHELGRRNGIIQAFVYVGPMFSGFLMAAVYAGLDGRGGWPGWRWLYVVCGCISLPCAIWTAFALPDLPSRARPNWLYSAEEIALARKRMPTETKLYTGLFKWKDIVRWHKTWQIYLFPLFFLCIGQVSQSGASMIFWVKSYNVPGQPPVFSVPQINLIPIGMNIITLVLGLTASWISDGLPRSRRWPIMAFCCTIGIIFPIALAATPVHPPNRSTRFALYYLTSLGSCFGGVIWTYVNETSRFDPEKRAYVGAVMNGASTVFSAWIPILTFPTNKQPYIVTGNYINAGFSFAALLITFAIAYLSERDNKTARLELEGQQQAVENRGLDSPGELDEKVPL